VYDIVHVGGIYTEESFQGFLLLEGFPKDIYFGYVDIYLLVVIVLHIK
jgi:hypothetical protein